MQKQPSTISQIVANPRAWVGATLGAIAFEPTIRALANGVGLMTGIAQNAAWWYGLPSEHWFQILCLLGAAYFIWSAAKDVDRKNEERARALKDETTKALAIPLKAIDIFCEREKFRLAWNTRSNVENALARYEQAIRDKEHKFPYYARPQPGLSDLSARADEVTNIIRQMCALIDKPNEAPPPLSRPDLAHTEIIDRKPHHGLNDRLFTIEANRPFLESHKGNLSALRGWFHTLSGDVMLISNRADESAEQLRKMMAMDR